MTRNFPSFEFYCAQTFLTWSLLGSLTHILSFANFSDPIIMSFYLQRGFIHCAPFWKLVQIGNLMKICHILQPSKFVLGHPSRGLFSTTMTRQCPGLSANPGVTDIAHISTLIAHCTLHTVWWLSPPLTPPLPTTSCWGETPPCSSPAAKRWGCKNFKLPPSRFDEILPLYFLASNVPQELLWLRKTQSIVSEICSGFYCSV